MKRILNSLAIGVMVLAMTSCNKQPQANDTKKSEKIETTVQTSEGQKIAYVDIDSIMSQYTYWKEVKKLMKNKEANIQKILAGKQQSLQQAAANFQQKIQASIQKQAQDAEALQQRLGNEYQNEVANYNKALSDSVHNYLKEYTKDKKYTIVLAKSGDNILYADKACDITDEVVKGLNKAYKGMKK